MALYSKPLLALRHASPHGFITSTTRLQHTLRMQSRHANRIRCSTFKESESTDDITIITSVGADHVDWQPSNRAVPQTYSSVGAKDVIIPRIDVDEEPAMFLTRVRPFEEMKLGVSEEMVRRISERNEEPDWMLQFRLDAFRQWLAMDVPRGAQCPPVDVHAMCAERVSARTSPDLEHEPNGESFADTHKEALGEAGVIFCSIAEAIRRHPEMVRRHLGKVVPPSDNFYAALNSAVFLDGSFCYVPAGVTCPMDISTHFLVDGRKTSSPFERTLIVCGERASVSSLGCTSPPPAGVTQQLNAPVIELFCAAGAEIKHVTVQNWLDAGATAKASTGSDAQEELLCNYVTQRGLCDGARSKITWTIVEAGSGATWQHPAVVLKGDESVGECFSVTLTDAHQHADTGAAMVHSGRRTRSRVVSKTISAGASKTSFRGDIYIEPWSRNARSEVQRESILIGNHVESTACPSIVARNTTAQIKESGSTSRINSEQVFLFQQRGIAAEKAVPAILSGFCDAVLRELPHEFESEVTEMVAMKIEEFLKGSPFCQNRQ